MYLSSKVKLANAMVSFQVVRAARSRNSRFISIPDQCQLFINHRLKKLSERGQRCPKHCFDCHHGYQEPSHVLTCWYSEVCGIDKSLILSTNEPKKLLPSSSYIREHWQLGFVKLNSNLAVNLKTTHPPLLTSRGQFTFLMTKSSHSSSIVVYPPKSEFVRN